MLPPLLAKNAYWMNLEHYCCFILQGYSDTYQLAELIILWIILSFFAFAQPNSCGIQND